MRLEKNPSHSLACPSHRSCTREQRSRAAGECAGSQSWNARPQPAIPLAGHARHPTGRISKSAQSQAGGHHAAAPRGGLQDRLVAAVAATWNNGSAKRTDRSREFARSSTPLSTDAHSPRYAAGSGRGRARNPTETIGETDRPQQRAEDEPVCAELPFGWLADVWSKGIATMSSRFRLAATTTDAPRAVEAENTIGVGRTAGIHELRQRGRRAGTHDRSRTRSSSGCSGGR